MHANAKYQLDDLMCIDYGYDANFMYPIPNHSRSFLGLLSIRWINTHE